MCGFQRKCHFFVLFNFFYFFACQGKFTKKTQKNNSLNYVIEKIQPNPRGGGIICTTVKAAAKKHPTPPSRMCGF